MQEVVNASDIRICLPETVESQELVPVAHIYSGTLSVQARFQTVTHIPASEESNDGIWERDEVIGMSWSISGSSYLITHPGHSFRTLSRIMVSLQAVPVKFKLDGLSEDYQGSVRIRRLRKVGNTEDNTEVFFDLKGQGKYEEVT